MEESHGNISNSPLSQKACRKILEAAREGIWITDTENKTVFVNPRMAELLGYTVDELLGRSSRDFKDERPGYRPGVPEDPGKGASERYEMEMTRKDGTRLWVDCQEMPLPGRDGKPIGHVEMFTDVTDRKHAEQENKQGLESLVHEGTARLEAANPRLRDWIRRHAREEEEMGLQATLLDMASDAIFLRDMDNNLVYVNQATCTLYGYSKKEFMGMNLRELVAPAELPFFEDKVKKVKELGQLRAEAMHMRKDGSVFPVEVHSRVVETKRGKSIVSVVRDITASKKAHEEFVEEHEQRLKANERLAEVGKLSGNIAHELRNPLATIDSSVFFLTATLKNPDPKTEKHLDRIRQAVAQSSRVIQNLLDQARMKEPDMRPVDLRALTGAVLDASELPPGIEVRRLFPDREVTVNVDSGQIRIVFNIVIDNAVQAMEGKGVLEVTVETRRMEAIITFKDSGPGIAPENLSKLFQPFFTTKPSGVGFGLAMARTIVERHGGLMKAESVFGEGATLIVCLPIKRN